MNDKQLSASKIFAIAVIIYAITINSPLVLSIVIGLVITTLLAILIECNDKELIDTFVEGELNKDAIKKYQEILLINLSIFIILTTIFYNIFK
jgi:hypothetical protein